MRELAGDLLAAITVLGMTNVSASSTHEKRAKEIGEYAETVARLFKMATTIQNCQSRNSRVVGPPSI
jgi:hypothetical protein